MPPSVILILQIVQFLPKQKGRTTKEVASSTSETQAHRDESVTRQYLKNVSGIRGSIQTMLHALCFCCLPFLESNCLQCNLQVVVGTELLFIYVVVVVVLQYCHSLYCVRRAQCVCCSLFCFFAGGLFLNA